MLKITTTVTCLYTSNTGGIKIPLLVRSEYKFFFFLSYDFPVITNSRDSLYATKSHTTIPMTSIEWHLFPWCNWDPYLRSSASSLHLPYLSGAYVGVVNGHAPLVAAPSRAASKLYQIPPMVSAFGILCKTNSNRVRWQPPLTYFVPSITQLTFKPFIISYVIYVWQLCFHLYVGANTLEMH